MLVGCFGFPRIGRKRELKWALETYWKNKNEVLLFNKLKELSLWQIKEQSLLDIACLDFSPYDFVLDTCIDAGLLQLENGMEDYFSFARGKNAFPMKKWFGNNFHYLSPTITYVGKVDIKWREWEKGIDEGIKKSVIKGVVGPYTLFKVCKWNGLDGIEICKKAFARLVEKYMLCYGGVLFHEPALAFSPCIEEVGEIYRWLGKEEKENIRIAIYYNRIEPDVLLTLTKRGISKIWLDFIDGEWIGCDLDEIGLGIVSGRTVEKANLLEVARLVNGMMEDMHVNNVVLHPSCPLFHVPITTDGENELIRRKCSFAVEKLKELKKINFILLSRSISGKKEKKEKNRKELQNRIFITSHANLTTKRMQRITTTVVGSFPQTKELRRTRKLWKEGKLSEKEYESFIFNMIEKAIKLQEDIGLDVLSHGEFEREDMVEFFANYCDAFCKLKNGWVQSYGNRCVKPPLLLFNPKAMDMRFFKFMLFAKNISDKEVKCILTGPITIVKWSLLLRNGEKYVDLIFARAREFAEILKNVVEQAAHHFSSIQLDEPALVELVIYGEKYTKRAIPIINTTLSKADRCVKYLHLCYGDVKPLIPIINQLSVDVVLLECYRQGLRAEDLNGLDKIIGVGCFDVHSTSIPSPKQIASFLSKYVKKFGRIVVCPDCGLKTRTWKEARKGLKNMVEAVRILEDKKNQISHVKENR